MLTALRAMVKKDLRLFFGDRRAMIMSFAAPIVIGSFFGYIFGGLGGRTQTSRIPVLIVDNDTSAISRDVTKQLSANRTLDVKASTADEAREAVKRGSASVAIVIPPQFGLKAGRALFSGSNRPEVGVLYDPSRAAEQGMVQGILTGIVMQSVSREMFSGGGGREMVNEALARVPAGDAAGLSNLLHAVQQWNERQNANTPSAASGGLTVPYEIHEEGVTARRGVAYNGYAHSFGGMGVQFILFMGIDAGITVLLQRQRGLWKRLRAAPLSRTILLGSRALSSAVISMLIFLVIFGFARVVFGVRIEGSFAGFLAVCSAFSLMTAAFGLLVAALGKTPEATRGIAAFVTIIMVMLGGAWVPSFIFPQWLQTVTQAIPTRWAMDALDGTVWRGMPFSSVLAPVAALLAAALVFGVVAAKRFRWETEG